MFETHRDLYKGKKVLLFFFFAFFNFSLHKNKLKMWQSVKKSVGLSSPEEYVQPRLSIGTAVSDKEFSTGHFKVQVDAQALALTVKNINGRTIWKCKFFFFDLLCVAEPRFNISSDSSIIIALQNMPFLSSSIGKDVITNADNGVFRVTETDEKFTRIQTITKIERENDSTIKIYGGLGPKLVLPTHMDYIFTFTEVSHRQLQFSVEIVQRDPSMNDFIRLFLTYESRPEEHFYGFGEQFSFASLKGQKVPILVRFVNEGWSYKITRIN